MHKARTIATSGRVVGGCRRLHGRVRAAVIYGERTSRLMEGR